MHINPDKFYSSNYRDFVHRQALEDALKLVAEIDLKDVEIDTILSITFSVDEYGENPMYVEYLDKEGKKHIVRIRPAVTNEIQEILKKYVTKEEHQADVETIYNYFNTLNVPMEIRSQNGIDDEGNKSITLNNDNSFISFQIDPENSESIQCLTIQNKNSTLGPQYQYLAKFTDYAKVDEVIDNETFLDAINELENKIRTGDETTLQEAKDYADTQDTTQRNEIITLINQGDEDNKSEILSVIDVKYDDLKSYVDSKDSEYFETGKRYSDNAKQEAIDESKNYANTKHNEALAVIEPCQTKLSNIWQSHRATFIYWIPNIDINTMKLENTENDVKVTLNDGDVVYWRKNAYQPVDLTDYYTKTESDEKFATETEVPSIKFNDTEDVTRIDFLPGSPDRIHVLTESGVRMNAAFITNGEKTAIANNTANINNLTQTIQEIATKVDGIETTAPQPIEMSVSYNGNTLELDNHSTYATIGNTTFVNINCSFTAPFVSGTTPITNTLNISSETLKSFPTFMIDCIVNTSTNISSYTTTTVFPNNFVRFDVVTPVIPSNENIVITSISLNGSFIFQQQ